MCLGTCLVDTHYITQSKEMLWKFVYVEQVRETLVGLVPFQGNRFMGSRDGGFGVEIWGE